MNNTMISIRDLGKEYQLGAIGGATLRETIADWWERKRSRTASPAAEKKKFWALRHIDFEVQKGEKIGIIGLNGAGKSTLLKILSRITAPTEGKAILNGSVASMLEVGTGFHGELTGRENIYLNGAILGMRKEEIDHKIEDIIQFSECERFIDTPVKRYSSGMYVKLAFSVAAHLDASILIMDEVLAVGDMKFQEKCLGKMKHVADHEGRTILYVSHNMNTIRKLCSRCIVLEHGKMVYDGEIEKAIALYTDRNFQLRVHNPLETLHPGVIKRMEFQALDVIQSKTCRYTHDDMYRFVLRFHAYVDYEHVHIRFIMRWHDDTPVGTFVSKDFSIEKDQDYRVNVALPLEQFPNGSYYIRITLSTVNSFGTHADLGRCEKAAYFIVERSGERYYGLDWVNWGWGAYLGRPAKMEISS